MTPQTSSTLPCPTPSPHAWPMLAAAHGLVSHAAPSIMLQLQNQHPINPLSCYQHFLDTSTPHTFPSHLADARRSAGLVVEVCHAAPPVRAQLRNQHMLQLGAGHDIRTLPHALQCCLNLHW